MPAWDDMALDHILVRLMRHTYLVTARIELGGTKDTDALTAFHLDITYDDRKFSFQVEWTAACDWVLIHIEQNYANFNSIRL